MSNNQSIEPIEVNELLGNFCGKVDPRSYFASGYGPDGRQCWLSNSMLRKIETNPYEWYMADSIKISKWMTHGSAVDCLLLTPELFEREFAINEEFSSYQTKKAREWKQQIEESDRIALNKDEYELAKEASEAMLYALDRMGIDLGSTHLTQVAMVTTVNAESGNEYYIKGLVDLFPNEVKTLEDIKTTSVNISDDRELRKLIFKMGYHKSMALYTWLYNEIHGEMPEETALIFQRTFYPHVSRRVVLTQNDLALGLADIMNQINVYDQCVTLGYWPGRIVTEMEGGLPKWAKEKNLIFFNDED